MRYDGRYPKMDRILDQVIVTTRATVSRFFYQITKNGGVEAKKTANRSIETHKLRRLNH